MAIVATSLVASIAGAPAPTATGSESVPDRWKATDDLNIARWGHSATVLDGPDCRTSAGQSVPEYCGSVLLAGGDSDDAFDSAELYDPTAETPQYRLITEESFGATDHEAVLLDPPACHDGTADPRYPCGDVLFVGGGVTGDARRYRPGDDDLDSWDSAGRHDTLARRQHTATLLRDGRVLVAGGRATQEPASLTASNVPLASTLIYDPKTEEWAEIEAMRNGRANHTATPLVDGTVLIAGGKGPNRATSRHRVPNAYNYIEAEIFDPAANAGQGGWRPTGSMSEARSEHTATRLPDGTVLVVGGFDDFDPSQLHSAEIFDPDADDGIGAWRRTSDLGIPRYGHTAELLVGPACEAAVPTADCGKVLVVGGNSPVAQDRAERGPPTAELFDPHGAGTYRDHDGSVVAVMGSWSRTGELAKARERGHTATLLDSSVCRRGSPAAWCGQILVSGGYTSDEATCDQCENTVTLGELFSPSLSARPPSVLQLSPDSGPTEGWTKVVISGTGFTSVSAVTFNGIPARHFRVDSTRQISASTPAGVAGSVQVRVTTPVATSAPLDRSLFTYVGSGGPRPPPTVTGLEPGGGPSAGGTPVTITGGHLAPAHGVHFGAVAASTLSFVSDTEITAAAPPQPRGVVDVTITTASGTSEASVAAEYTYGEGAWSETDPLRDCPPDAGPDECRGRYQHSATLLDPAICHTDAPSPGYPCGEVLVAGGTTNFFYGPALSTAQRYDATSRTWTTSGSMHEARFDHTATLLDGPACRAGDDVPSYCGKVLVVGGREKPLRGPGCCSAGELGLNSVELYNPRDGSWSSCTDTNATSACPAPLAAPRLSHTATPLSDGRVLVAGGALNETARALALGTAEIYNPVSGRWSPVLPMATPRANHTATLLENGTVLVAGGMTLDPHGTERAGKACVGNTRVDPVTLRIESQCELDPRAGTPVQGVEIYDPVLGVWRPTAPLDVARFSHTATLLSGPRCGSHCGKVLVAGGVSGRRRGGQLENAVFVNSAELYDPMSHRWSPTGVLHRGRGGHSATLLRDGTVLVAGRGMTFPASPGFPSASAETYDPSSGRWSTTSEMHSARGLHTATLLDGPPCRRGGQHEYCDKVLVAGGAIAGGAYAPPATDSVEVYTPAPTTFGIGPAVGPIAGGTSVVIAGSGFTAATRVRFGNAPASFVIDSPAQITAVSPPQPAGPVDVIVESDGGTSATIASRPAVRFVYLGTPGKVIDLVATRVSDGEVILSFSAPPASEGADAMPAGAFVVKQADESIEDPETFSAAASICPDEVCRFSPTALGQQLTLSVTGLEPDRSYHYALRALNDVGALGPLSNPASVIGRNLCPAVSAMAGQIVYPGQRYSLVGLPGGTLVPANSPLYTWLDTGAGGTYSSQATSQPVASGRGYWAWFACPTAVDLAGAGVPRVSFPLGGYHASMVGNSSGISMATLSGHDFAARWDPGANGGTGGYELSEYQQPQHLGSGEGRWVFSYQPTTIVIDAG